MRTLVLIAVWLITLGAIAQPTSQPDTAPASQPDTEPASLEVASSPLEEALARFAAGEFAKAEALLVEYLEGESPEPIAYYYLGRCREANRDFGGALEAYRRFLEISPAAKEAPRVRLKIAELEEIPPPKEPSTLPRNSSSSVEQVIENEEPIRPTKRREGLRSYSPQAKIGHMFIGLGSMGIVTGLMFASLAEGRERFLETSGAFAPGFDPVEFDANFQALFDQGRRFQKTALISLGSGSAAILGGLLLALTARKKDKDDDHLDASVFLSPSPGGASLGVRGAF